MYKLVKISADVVSSGCALAGQGEKPYAYDVNKTQAIALPRDRTGRWTHVGGGRSINVPLGPQCSSGQLLCCVFASSMDNL